MKNFNSKKLSLLNKYYNKNLSNIITKLFIHNSAESPTICPHCSGTYIVKNGKNKLKQRYLCKKCNKSFINETNTPIYCSKKNINLWIKFIDYQLSDYTIRQAASALNITISTSFKWRHKLLNIIKCNELNKTLSETVFCKSIYFVESFKGNHKNSSFKMPREPHNGPLTSKNILSAKRVPIILALDSSNNMIVSPITHQNCSVCTSGLKYNNKCIFPSNKHNHIRRHKNFKIAECSIIDIFKNKLKPNSELIFQNIPELNQYSFFMSSFSIRKLSKLCCEHNYLPIISRKLSFFFLKYRGIATKYLNNYLSLFKMKYNLALK